MQRNLKFNEKIGKVTLIYIVFSLWYVKFKKWFEIFINYYFIVNPVTWEIFYRTEKKKKLSSKEFFI